jgi:O-methyltransferase
MLRYKIKRFLHPLRLMSRRWAMLPTMEEQGYVNTRGCLHSASTFVTRNLVAGDYLEFGVWKGDSFIKAYHSLTTIRRQHMAWLTRHPTQQSEHGKATSHYEIWKEMKPRFIAFDSFAGLPETGADELHENWAKGSYACDEERFKANISSEGVNLKDVITVPGFYDKSLTPALKKKYNLTKAAIVNVDCDLYESTITVLDFITDLVQQGTILVFDDWFCYQGRPDRGEQKACREWLSRNPHLELIEYWREPPQPMSFIVNFKNQP